MLRTYLQCRIAPHLRLARFWIFWMCCPRLGRFFYWCCQSVMTWQLYRYNDVTASQITGNSTVFLIVLFRPTAKKHQSSTIPVPVKGIHWRPADSPPKGQSRKIMQKSFPCHNHIYDISKYPRHQLDTPMKGFIIFDNTSCFTCTHH